jgi:hypothetical protein
MLKLQLGRRRFILLVSLIRRYSQPGYRYRCFVQIAPNPASPVQGRSRANKGHTNWYQDYAMTTYTSLVTIMMAAGAIFVLRVVAPHLTYPC